MEGASFERVEQTGIDAALKSRLSLYLCEVNVTYEPKYNDYIPTPFWGRSRLASIHEALLPVITPREQRFAPRRRHREKKKRNQRTKTIHRFLLEELTEAV